MGRDYEISVLLTNSCKISPMPLSGLLALIETLDHDQREEDGKLVHSCQR
jgi:hypothetical protein